MVSAKDFVTAGQTWQPPNASLFNAFVQAAISRERVNRDGNPAARPVQRVSIQIQSATDVVPGTAVGFGAPTNLVTAAGESRLDAIFASGSLEEGRWAVAIDGISANAVSDCALTGVAWAEVDVVDATHEWADVVLGVVTSGTGGYAKILYKPGGTGVAWCCLHLGFDPRVGEVVEEVDSMKECLCAVLEIMTANLSLEDAEQTRLDNECAVCPEVFMACHACQAPGTITMTLANFVNPGNVVIPKGGGVGTVGATIDFTALNGQTITVNDLAELSYPFCHYNDLGIQITLPVTWDGGDADVYVDEAVFRISNFRIEADSSGPDKWRMQYAFIFTIHLQPEFPPPSFNPYEATLLVDEKTDTGSTTNHYACGETGNENVQTMLDANPLTSNHFRENVGGDGDFA